MNPDRWIVSKLRLFTPCSGLLNAGVNLKFFFGIKGVDPGALINKYGNP